MTDTPRRSRRRSAATDGLTLVPPVDPGATEEPEGATGAGQASQAAGEPEKGHDEGPQEGIMAVLRHPKVEEVFRRGQPDPTPEGPTVESVKARRARRDGAPAAPQQRAPLFQPLSEVREYVNALYYGKEGSGKTSAVAQMSQLGRVVVINAEGGLKIRPLQNRGVNVDNIVVYPPRGEQASFEGIEQVIEQLAHDLREDPNSWAGVIVDSATEVYAACLEEATDKRVRSVRESKGIDIDKWFTDRADYGEANKKMRSILRRLRDLPCHFAVTALERRDVDEDTQKVAYGPSVSPGLAADLLGYMDVVLVARAADEKGPFRALTKGSGRYRAKDRFDILPPILEDPRFDTVVQIIEQS